MSGQGRKAKRVLDVVWFNGADRRFIPRALRPDVDHSWGVWDQRDERWIEGADLMRIDPDEPQRPN